MSRCTCGGPQLAGPALCEWCDDAPLRDAEHRLREAETLLRDAQADALDCAWRGEWEHYALALADAWELGASIQAIGEELDYHLAG